jgi:hypothetical protein
MTYQEAERKSHISFIEHKKAEGHPFVFCCNYSERQKKVVMVRGQIVRKIPPSPLSQRGARGDFGLSVRSVLKDRCCHVYLLRSFTIIPVSAEKRG